MRRFILFLQDHVIEVAGIVLIFMVWGLVAYQWYECTSCGGKFVRGVVWFECLKGV